MTLITDLDGLESRLGRAPPGARDVKVIPYLDDGARMWIDASPLAFVCVAGSSGPSMSLAGSPGPRMSLAGSVAGFADASRSDVLVLPRPALDDGGMAEIGAGIGTLFLVPGLGETLRVNGRVAAVSPDAIEIAVEECFMHCAKALIRSDFWSASSEAGAPDDARAFLNASRFMALGTADADGRCDVSPKGDPAGRLVQQDGDEAWFAERPGNRRADGYRNLLTQPKLAAALLVPGNPRVALLSGRAEITSREDVRERFFVKDKGPLLVTRIAGLDVELVESAALSRSGAWTSRAAPTIDPASIMAGHVRLNRSGGVQAALARTLVSVPGLMRLGLKSDYKRNLY